MAAHAFIVQEVVFSHIAVVGSLVASLFVISARLGNHLFFGQLEKRKKAFGFLLDFEGTLIDGNGARVFRNLCLNSGVNGSGSALYSANGSIHSLVELVEHAQNVFGNIQGQHRGQHEVHHVDHFLTRRNFT